MEDDNTKPTDWGFWAIVLLAVFGAATMVHDGGPGLGLALIIAAVIAMALLLPTLRREREDAEDALRRSTSRNAEQSRVFGADTEAMKRSYAERRSDQSAGSFAPRSTD